MKNKFKVGDMVECIESGYDSLTLGRPYKVSEVFDTMLRLRRDDKVLSYYHTDYFKLSNPKPMIRDTKGRFTGKKENQDSYDTENIERIVRRVVKEELEKENKITITNTPKEVVQSGFFDPKEGEKFCYSCVGENINYTTFDDSDFHNDLVSIGNCFRNKQDLLDHLEYLKAIRRIKKYIYENGMSCSINRNERYYEVFYSFLEERWMTYPLLNISPSHILPCLPTMDNANKLIQDCASDLEIIKNYSMSHNF